jgi:hypothetical protein
LWKQARVRLSQLRDVLALAPNVEHAARSASGCVFLLTIVHSTSNTGVTGPEFPL